MKSKTSGKFGDQLYDIQRKQWIWVSFSFLTLCLRQINMCKLFYSMLFTSRQFLFLFCDNDEEEENDMKMKAGVLGVWALSCFNSQITIVMELGFGLVLSQGERDQMLLEAFSWPFLGTCLSHLNFMAKCAQVPTFRIAIHFSNGVFHPRKARCMSPSYLSSAQRQKKNVVWI